MLVRNGEDFLELTVTDRSAAGLPDAGDTRFGVRVRVTGSGTVFTGETWCWVRLGALTAFAEQLRALEQRREGAALLEAMSPGELRLEVRPTDRLGHMAAFGQIGHWCYSDANGPYWSSLTFAVPFDPTELPTLVRKFNALATASKGVGIE